MNTLVLMFLVVVLVGLPVIVTVYRQLRLRFARPGASGPAADGASVLV